MFDYLLPRLCVVGLALCTACTAGQVTQNGVPVPGFVHIQTCDPQDPYVTITLPADGSWWFNPFSSTSTEFAPDQYVPEGPILIRVTSAFGEYVELHDHQYDQTCNFTVNNVYGPNECKLYDMHFEPMTPTEIGILELQHSYACRAL